MTPPSGGKGARISATATHVLEAERTKAGVGNTGECRQGIRQRHKGKGRGMEKKSPGLSWGGLKGEKGKNQKGTGFEKFKSLLPATNCRGYGDNHADARNRGFKDAEKRGTHMTREGGPFRQGSQESQQPTRTNETGTSADCSKKGARALASFSDEIKFKEKEKKKQKKNSNPLKGGLRKNHPEGKGCS